MTLHQNLQLCPPYLTGIKKKECVSISKKNAWAMKELKSTQKLGKTGQEKKIFSLNMEVSEMTISRMVEVNFQK